MIREGKYIYISSRREAATVFEYYEPFGIRPRALSVSNCLQFPYLGITDWDDKLLTGWRAVNGNVISYRDWLETIREQPEKIDVDISLDVDISQVVSELFSGV